MLEEEFIGEPLGESLDEPRDDARSRDHALSRARSIVIWVAADDLLLGDVYKWHTWLHTWLHTRSLLIINKPRTCKI